MRGRGREVVEDDGGALVGRGRHCDEVDERREDEEDGDG